MTASFTLATDVTTGRYVASITNSIRTCAFNPGLLFRVWLYDTVAEDTTEHPSSTDWTIVESTVGLVTTITATLIADSAIVMVFSITREDDEVAFALVRAQGGGTTAVYAYSFPEFLTVPATVGAVAATFAEAHPYAGGFTLPQPHLGGAATVCGPDQMQFISLFNTTNQHHLYLWSNDERACPKIFGTQGNTVECLYGYTHYADLRLTPSTWTRDYVVRATMFIGKAVDGRYGAVEAALRYRRWAAASTRPWRSRGLWKDSGVMSAFARECDFHVSLTGLQNAARWTSDLVKWRSTGGFDKPLMTIYSWKNPGDFAEVFTPEPTHAGAISATTKALITTMRAAGWRVMPYTQAHNFDNRASAGWRHDDWDSGEGLPSDLLPYVCRKPNGTVREFALGDSSVAVHGAGDMATFDFGSGAGATYARDVFGRIMAALAPVEPGAFYLDALGSSIPLTPMTDPSGTGGTDYQDDDPTWTFSDFITGKQGYYRGVRDYLRETDEDAFVMTEWPAEWVLPFIDIAFTHENHSNIGAPAGLMQVVHGDVVRWSSFGISIVTSDNPLLSVYAVVQSVYHWLRSGIFVYNDGLDITSKTVFGSGAIEDSGLYYFIRMAQKLRAMKTPCRRYFEGSLYRPKFVDWRAGMYAACTAAVARWKDLISTDSFFMADTLRTEDGDLGINVVYAYPGAEDILPAHVGAITVLPSETRTLNIDADDDELRPGLHKVYRTVDGGVREYLGEFRRTFSMSFTFRPWSVTLIEVVFVDERRALRLARPFHRGGTGEAMPATPETEQMRGK